MYRTDEDKSLIPGVADPTALLMRLAGLFAMLLALLPNFAGTLRAQTSTPSPLLQIDTGGHQATIKDVAFTPDGQFIVSAGDDKVIRVWDWQRGETVREIRGESGPGHAGKYYAMALSPDGNLLAAAGWLDAADAVEPCCGDIRLFDFRTGKLVRLLKGHDSNVYDLAFSPDGRFLASGGADNTALVFDLQTFTIAHRLEGHEKRVNQLAFSSDGRRLFTASYDGELRLWSLDDGKLVQRMQGHATRIFAIAVAADGKRLASGDADGKIRLWDAVSGEGKGEFADQKVSIGSLNFSRDGRQLLATCSFRCPENPGAFLYDVASGKAVQVYKGHDDMVRASTMSPDGKWAVTAGGNNNEIHVWNLQTGDLRQKLAGLGRIVYAVGFSPDGERLAFGDTHPCPSETACPNAVAQLDFVLGLPSSTRALERPRKRMAGAGEFLRAIAEQNGWTLKARAGGEYQRPDAILDLTDGKRPRGSIIRGATDGFGHSAYTFTREGAGLISGGDHGVLRAYLKKTAAPVLDYVGHEGQIMALAISPNGALLASASADQTVRLWNLRTGELLVSLLHAESGDWVMWTPQGYYDSSPNGDRMIGWQVNQGAELEARFIKARQLKQHLHSPEIIRRAISGGSAIRAIEDLRGKDPQLIRLLARKPPSFEVASPAFGSRVAGAEAQVVLQLQTDEEAPLEFEVAVNNRNVSAAATRGLKPVQQSGADNTTAGASKTLTVPLHNGRNDILIRARNQFGYIAERRLVIEGTGEGGLDKKGRLNIIAVGVNNYPNLPKVCSGPGGSCELSYAVADASDFLGTVIAKAGPLHAETARLLLVNGGDSAPTASNITTRIRDMLAASKPEDTTILFVAGHGVNIREDYFFVPTDAAMSQGNEWRNDSLVRWDVFAAALEQTEGTRMLFIDTCHAANAYNAKLEKQAGDARIVVFSATKPNSVSAELSEVGHGVFTHALLEGLAGEADHSGDSSIKILELGSYTSDKVEQLTNKSQVPVFYLSGVEDFVLARP